MPEDEKVMALALDIIKKGGLVAIPTETVYGLAGNALDPLSSGKIYAAKGRPSDNPLIVHIADTGDLPVIAADIPKEAYALADAFWPGPLTMILHKTDAVPKETTGGLDTVAVRMPSDNIASEFIRICGPFIAAPSANASGRPSCTTAEHVYEDLKGKIELIIDGGPVGIGLESTIVDLTEDIPCLLRPGYIDPEKIKQVTGRLNIDPTVLGAASKDLRPKAPGMKYRHYAPKGDMVIVSGDRDKVISYINSKCEEAGRQGINTAVLCISEDKPFYKSSFICDIGSADDGDLIAHNLFSALREFDERGAKLIFSETFDIPGIGMAVMNRLLKAAGHKIINV